MKQALGEVWAGFARPFVLVRGLRARPDAWAQYRKVIVLQSLAALVVAGVVLALGDGPARALDDEEPELSELLPAPRAVDGEVAPAAAARVDDPAPRLPEAARPTTPARSWHQLASAWFALLLSALVIGQWLTLALTREFQAPIARALSAVAGIEPEDDDVPPRVRLDWKWLKKKLAQRVRGVLVLLPGFVAFVPVLLVTLPLGADDFVMPPLMFGWSAYWWCAFTVGRSDRAWRDEAAATPPLPVRWWVARTSDTAGLRWFLPRWLARFGLWATKRDAAPAVAMERAPLFFLGLGLARLVTSPPVVRLAFRAAIDTAAAEALERHPSQSASK